ncbi:hypothetical protein JB92DRAFT_3109567 [Gautieria morchelliformis]|nr:hypothetical protein JB92DRAFT_3109567 [Gautieria morchelliformis]
MTSERCPSPHRDSVPYDSIHGALGARRDMSDPRYAYPPYPYDPHAVYAPPRMRTPVVPPAVPYLPQYALPSGMPAPSWAPPYPYPLSPTDASVGSLVRGDPAHAPDPKGKQRAPVSPIPQRAPASPVQQRASPAPQEPDYHKVSQTYRAIFDDVSHPPALHHPQPSGLPDHVLARIHECALEGVRHFVPPPPPRFPTPLRHTPAKRFVPPYRPHGQPAETQHCMGCGATSTPEWRRGPLGPRTLCNACGLVYAKLIKKRRPGGSKPARAREGTSSHAREGMSSIAREGTSSHARDGPSGLAGTAPGVFIHDFAAIAIAQGQPRAAEHDDDERDGAAHAASSPEAEGSDDGSFEDHSAHGPRQEDRD